MISSAMDSWKAGFLLNISAVKAMQNLAQVQVDASGKSHVKEYRPQFLVLCGQPELRPALVKFATALYKGGGVQFFCNVLLEDYARVGDDGESVLTPAQLSANVRKQCNEARDDGLEYLRDEMEVGCLLPVR